MKRIILVGILAIFSFVGYGVSFDAFTEIQDAGKLSFSPMFKVPTTFDSVSIDLWFGYGVVDNFDVWLNASTLIFSGSLEWGGFYVLPRYDLGAASILEYNVIGVGLGYNGGFLVDVQYHTGLKIIEKLLSLEVNIVGSVLPSFSVSGIFAPVISVLDWLSIYAQIDPSFEFESSSFGVEYKFGIDISFSEYGELNVSYSTSQEIGVWYSITF